MTVSGFIQAGGRSARMGTDKAWLRFGPQTTIERVVQALRPVVHHLAVVTGKDGYDELGLPIYDDIIKDYGPLGGIYTALSHTTEDLCLMVACDLPFLTPALFQTLLQLQPGYDIVVPVSAEGQPQPLCALYARRCLPVVESLIREEVRPPRRLFELAPTRLVAWPEIAVLPGADHFFLNMNTPADYQRALSIYLQANS